jgi:hypothetical protein
MHSENETLPTPESAKIDEVATTVRTLREEVDARPTTPAVRNLIVATVNDINRQLAGHMLDALEGDDDARQTALAHLRRAAGRT